MVQVILSGYSLTKDRLVLLVQSNDTGEFIQLHLGRSVKNQKEDVVNSGAGVSGLVISTGSSII